MATYKQIQEFVNPKIGKKTQTCWIASAKEHYNVPVSKAHNRISEKRHKPCPEKYLPYIRDAFVHFGMLDS
jgi:hypothetical protein